FSQRLRSFLAPNRPALVTTSLRGPGECPQHTEEEPAVPDTLALAFSPDPIHPIIPIARAHQRQTVSAEPITTFQGTHAMLVDCANVVAHAGKVKVLFLIVA